MTLNPLTVKLKTPPQRHNPFPICTSLGYTAEMGAAPEMCVFVCEAVARKENKTIWKSKEIHHGHNI